MISRAHHFPEMLAEMHTGKMPFSSHRSRESETKTAETASECGYAASKRNHESCCLESTKMSFEMELFPQGFCLALPLSNPQMFGAAVREHQTSIQRRNPSLSILRISRSLKSGRTLTKDVLVTLQLPLPSISSLHKSSTFLNPRDWNTTATACCLPAYPGCRDGGC